MIHTRATNNSHADPASTLCSVQARREQRRVRKIGEGIFMRCWLLGGGGAEEGRGQGWGGGGREGA